MFIRSLLCFLLLALPANAERATVAVATNVFVPLQEISERFESETGHEVRLVSGATGKLYAQIMHGAPYDVFLAADAARPLLLLETGKAVPETEFTYAVGRLALWSAQRDLFDDGRAFLETGAYRRIALANPELAPYGLAAKQTLMNLGLSNVQADKGVFGENIGQAFAFVSTQNAEIGLVALSLARGKGGTLWEIPATLHEPIRQNGVLLTRGADNTAAKAFVEYILRDDVQTYLESVGYGHLND